MQQQTAHLAGDQRVKFFTGRLWSHLFGRTSGRRRPTAGHRAGRADGAPAVRTPLAFLVLGLFVAADALAAGTATVTLRPTHVDISATSSRQAVLMTLSGYSAGNEPKYRLYNGSYQYAPWDSNTASFVTSTSYSSGPLAVGDYVNGTTFWILCERNNNANATATYRDRVSPYSANNNTVALPSATAISSPFTLSGTLVDNSCPYDLDVRYVILGFDSTSGGTLLCSSFSDVTTGSFSLVCHGGHTIRRVEVRTIDNTTISAATQTGTWTSTTALGSINLCSSASAPTLSSPTATSIGQTGATLGGSVTADGGATVTDRGVVYKTTSGVTINDNKRQIGSGTGAFSQNISGLAVNTRYYFRAYAINSAGQTLGTELNFWTPAKPDGWRNER